MTRPTPPSASPARMVRVVAALFGAVVLCTGGLWSVPSGSLAPAAAAGCTGGSGVTVVVDFGVYGGVRTGCAADPGNGLSALSQAGFAVAQVSSQPGFVCRIDGLPPVEDDACVRTPPADAYWSYWQATAGGDWAYSSTGASATTPGDGDTEGWAFGADSPPGLAPPPNTAAPSPPPPPPATTSRASTPRTTSPRPTTSTGGTAPSSSPPVVTTSVGTTGSDGTDAATSGPSRPPTSSAGGPPTPATTAPTTPATTATAGSPDPDDELGAAPAASAAPDEGGSPWPLLAGSATVLALGGGTWWQVRRRG